MNSGTIAGLTSAPLKTKAWSNIKKTITSSGVVSWKTGLGSIAQILGPSDQDLIINSGKLAIPNPVVTTAGKNLILNAGAAVKGSDLGGAYGGSTYITAGDTFSEFGTWSGGFTSIKGGKGNGGTYSGEIIVWGGYGGNNTNGNTGGYGVSITGSSPIFIGPLDSGGGGSSVNIKAASSGGGGSTGYDGGYVSIISGNAQSTFTNMNPPGNGGPITFTAGNGGRASTGTGGTGGSITITSGNGGLLSTTQGNSGNITLATGTGLVAGSIFLTTGSTTPVTISSTLTKITNPAKIEVIKVSDNNNTAIQLDVTNYAGTVINCTSTSNVTITLPTTNVPVGYNVTVIRSGTGTVTFVEGTVTVGGAANIIKSYNSLKSIDGVNSTATLICLNSGSSGVSAEYNLSGSLIA